MKRRNCGYIDNPSYQVVCALTGARPTVKAAQNRTAAMKWIYAFARELARRGEDAYDLWIDVGGRKQFFRWEDLVEAGTRSNPRRRRNPGAVWRGIVPPAEYRYTYARRNPDWRVTCNGKALRPCDSYEECVRYAKQQAAVNAAYGEPTVIKITSPNGLTRAHKA